MTTILCLFLIGLVGLCLVVAGTRDLHPWERFGEWRERRFMEDL